jgi:GNAT superfamily N-acetyltransferase
MFVITSSISLRPFTASDAPLVVDLVNAEGRRSLEMTRATLDAFGQVRLIRYVPAHNKSVVAITPQNQIVGYAYVANREQHIVYEMGGAVDPDHWGQGIGAQLLAWSEQQAKTLSQSAPAGVQVVLQGNLFEGEHKAQSLFTHAGFQQRREWLHFALEMHAPPPSVVLPNRIKIQPIDLEHDWDLLGPAMDDAFADHWGTIMDTLMASLPELPVPDAAPEADMPEDESFSNAPGFCFMALEDDVIAGGILCNAKLVERNDTGRVGSVFVRPRYRRQGIGRALMHTAFHAFWRAGLRRVVLDTDAGSFNQSPLFYAQMGMQIYRREYLYEKVIRPGREVRRLTM